MGAPQVSLREITSETLRDILKLRVAPEQESFVAANAVSIAEAHYAGDRAWFRAIYDGDAPVGFVMIEAAPAPDRPVYLWRFMIDARHQGRSLGRRAIALVLDEARGRGARVIETSCVPGLGGPGPFYEKLGFAYTGAEEEGQLVMRRDL